MTKRFRRFRAVLALLAFQILLSSATLAQVVDQQNDNRNKTAVINFFVQVDTNSVNQLVGIIDAQMRLGFHKFKILISSTGGETTSAFTAYNYLRGLKADITTFNVGNVDSSAAVLFCAAGKRYSLPGTRFLFHGASVGVPGNSLINEEGLETQLALVKNQNQMIVTVMAAATHKKESELQNIVRGQTIWSPEEAKNAGLVQEIRTEFMDADSVLVTTIAMPSTPVPKPDLQIRTLPPIQTSPDMRLSGKSPSKP